MIRRKLTKAEFGALKASQKAVIIQAKIAQEAKEARKEIPLRIRHLKGLVHDTFPYPVYNAAKQKVRELGVAGGPAYNEAVEMVKWCKSSEEDYQEAVHYLTV